MPSVPAGPSRRPSNFQQIVDAFLLQPGLPFSQVLSAERIERVFAACEGLSGSQVAFVAHFTDGSSGIYLATVPEPPTLALIAIGLGLLAWKKRRA